MAGSQGRFGGNRWEASSLNTLRCRWYCVGIICSKVFFVWSIAFWANSEAVVTITPYLSRDTTYCYRHCKGISRFPLLLHHPSPRPMPDRITSASSTFIYVITPYRTHDSNPITRIASWTISFLCYLHPIPP